MNLRYEQIYIYIWFIEPLKTDLSDLLASQAQSVRVVSYCHLTCLVFTPAPGVEVSLEEPHGRLNCTGIWMVVLLLLFQGSL